MKWNAKWKVNACNLRKDCQHKQSNQNFLQACYTVCVGRNSEGFVRSPFIPPADRGVGEGLRKSPRSACNSPIQHVRVKLLGSRAGNLSLSFTGIESSQWRDEVGLGSERFSIFVFFEMSRRKYKSESQSISEMSVEKLGVSPLGGNFLSRVRGKTVAFPPDEIYNFAKVHILFEKKTPGILNLWNKSNVDPGSLSDLSAGPEVDICLTSCQTCQLRRDVCMTSSHGSQNMTPSGSATRSSCHSHIFLFQWMFNAWPVVYKHKALILSRPGEIQMYRNVIGQGIFFN